MQDHAETHNLYFHHISKMFIRCTCLQFKSPFKVIESDDCTVQSCLLSNAELSQSNVREMLDARHSKQVCNCSTLLLLSAVINPAESMFLLKSSDSSLPLVMTKLDSQTLQCLTRIVWLVQGF